MATTTTMADEGEDEEEDDDNDYKGRDVTGRQVASQAIKRRQ